MDNSESLRINRGLLFGCGVVILLAGMVSFFPIEDSDDDWWQLKAGKLLYEGQIGWYSKDPFTFSAQEKVWINHEWLAQVVFSLAATWGGLNTANLLKALLIIGTFVCVFQTARQQTGITLYGALVATLLAIPTAQFTFYLRPPVWTFLFLAFYHHLFLVIQKKGSPPRSRHTFLFFVILMIVWANLHGGAILGSVVVFLMWIGSGIEAIGNNGHSIGGPSSPTWERPRSNRWDGFKQWGFLFLLVLLASLVNPYGYRLHLLTFEVMSEKWLTERIFELAPPRVDLIWTLPMLLIPALLGILRHASWGSRLVFLFLLWQGLSHVRHLPLLALWAAPYAAKVISEIPLNVPLKKLSAVGGAVIILSVLLVNVPSSFMVLFTHEKIRIGIVITIALITAAICFSRASWKKGGLAFWVTALIAILFVVMIAGQRPQRCWQAIKGEAWSGRNFPDQLADFILEHQIKAPVLFTRETGAGLLIWKLAPETMRVFSCTRFDLQGGYPIKEIESMLWMLPEWTDPDHGETIPGWEELWNRKYRFDLVLLEKYADPDNGKVFKLWDYLNQPESGFVRVAGEAYPGPGPADRQFTLFLRQGPELTRLMKELSQPAWFEEKSGIEAF
jgi:hypothetical protein